MKLLHTLSKAAWFLVFLSSGLPASAQAVTTQPVTKVQQDLGNFRSDGRVRVNLLSGGHVTGNISALDDTSVSLSQPNAPDRTVAFADIKSVRDRSSLGSRFQMGPCIGPVTMVIASPFIVARYLLGR